MCGQLHQTMPGSGVLSHHMSHAPPSRRLACRSSTPNSSGCSCSKRRAVSVATLPSPNTRVTMEAAAAEVVAPPARPGAPHVPAHATVLGRRRHGQAELLEPLDGFTDESRRGDLATVHHVVEHEHHPTGREPAEIRIALDQRDPCAAARRGHGGAHAGRTATHHEHVAPVDDRRRARRVRDRRRRHQATPPCLHVTTPRPAKLTTAKKTTAQAEETNTVA